MAWPGREQLTMLSLPTKLHGKQICARCDHVIANNVEQPQCRLERLAVAGHWQEL